MAVIPAVVLISTLCDGVSVMKIESWSHSDMNSHRPTLGKNQVYCYDPVSHTAAGKVISNHQPDKTVLGNGPTVTWLLLNEHDTRACSSTSNTPVLLDQSGLLIHEQYPLMQYIASRNTALMALCLALSINFVIGISSTFELVLWVYTVQRPVPAIYSSTVLFWSM
ncbi:hypothetical protein BU25DRAFT_410312 [Macroventuria anomochaeta]|uniref:Uncharacterized protein n=1 Tax=Macroventuria anomochaeta TaxID=301207 RepID=A0ACB6S1P6_9PLEO|nr:uncharacterized protein BU25DRAFT_410312 [Macroventuria anomochaeta]KAF2628205.1 hypothetical protein BU25DRAFT_410312 [Macroventuria anomochaeta]